MLCDPGCVRVDVECFPVEALLAPLCPLALSADSVSPRQPPPSIPDNHLAASKPHPTLLHLARHGQA